MAAEVRHPMTRKAALFTALLIDTSFAVIQTVQGAQMSHVVTDIDPVAVLEALGIQALDPPVAVPGGWDTALFRFRTADGAWHALRVFRSSSEWDRALREQVSLRAAADADIPVPRVEAAGTWRDLPAVVLSWVPGRTVLDAIKSRPWRVWSLGKAFGRMQARIHAVPAPKEFSDPSLTGYLGEFLEWARGLDPVLPTRLEQAGLRQGNLIHGDYHPLNVLTDGHRITGVLDWPSSGSADPRVDIGHTAVLLETGPLPPGPIRPLVRALRGLFYRAWKHGYEDVAGSPKDIGPFMVLAGLSWLRDLEWAADRPGVWGELDARPVREWTERWKRKVRFG